jgi:mevalonate kinase
MLTGEYLALLGATTLAIPAKKGQHLFVYNYPEGIKWQARDHNDDIWLDVHLSNDLNVLSSSDEHSADLLVQILKKASELNPDFSGQLRNSEVHTRLEFNRHWGLGSSSTLIDLVSQWSSTKPHDLLSGTMGGSGYDVACASASRPILYSNQDQPVWHEVDWCPPFLDDLFLIYMNQKQSSAAEVDRFMSSKGIFEDEIRLISEMSHRITKCLALDEFQLLLKQHEEIMSSVLKQPAVADKWFKDIPGAFKSLGAWGGDFVLFAGEKEALEHIKERGFHTILRFNEIALL